ncbi:hypothetical protein [Bdellovibrio sp. HCB209]|uniref:hypothetical protein n=1 Tax=Bdellovibrio sp. HCB209 TaxID=3394354 RepID=UPI0039B68D84
MKAFIIGAVLLASTAASAATKCVAVTDRMNLQLEQKENSVSVKYAMNARDYAKYGEQIIPGVKVVFQEGMAYELEGITVDGLLANKNGLTKLVVRGIYSTAFFAGGEDMAYVDAGDLIAALKCQ